MKLKIIQNSRAINTWIGRSREESTSYTLAIVDEAGEIVAQNGIDCLLHYNGAEHNPSDFQELDNLSWIFETCWEYAERIISSTDYKAHCIAFQQVLMDNFAAIEENTIAEQKEILQRKIERIQKDMENLSIEDIRDEAHHIYSEELEKYKSFKTDAYNKMHDCKEGTPTYEEERKDFLRYSGRVYKYKELLAKIEDSDS